jgi:hypothetical protein
VAAHTLNPADVVATDEGVIEVRVRELDQLYNLMDPSPFHERDLDPDAEEYIVGSAKELPTRSPSALLVYLEQPPPPDLPDAQRIVRDAIHVHFTRLARLARWELKQLLRRGWISLIIGLTFLAACLVGGQAILRSFGHTPLATVFRESLVIGGWVAMWTPMEIFLHGWWPKVGQIRIYDRLSRVPVRIVCVGDKSSGTSARRDAESGQSSVPALTT